MSYEKVDWSSAKPINVTNLKNMDEGIANLENAITETQTNLQNAINGIVESGSNDNGSWTKWADGTMICTGTKYVDTITWTEDTSFGEFSYSGSYDDFPQTFISPPEVIKSCKRVTPSNRFLIFNANEASITVTNAGGFILRNYWAATNTKAWVTYIAIGKWK